MPRVNLIVILMTYVRYLYSINCPTVICLPSMLLFILWRDATSELWISVQFPLHYFTILLLLALFSLLALLLSFYHLIRSILCSQQTGEIDNLIEVGSKVLGCAVCRFHVAARWRSSYVNYAPAFLGAIVRSVVKLASITFWSLAFSYWSINLGFITEENLLLCSTKPSLWGSQLGALTSHHHMSPEITWFVVLHGCVAPWIKLNRCVPVFSRHTCPFFHFRIRRRKFKFIWTQI
jgi:hypothetical protein